MKIEFKDKTIGDLASQLNINKKDFLLSDIFDYIEKSAKLNTPSREKLVL